jgi:hypothetical protein
MPAAEIRDPANAERTYHEALGRFVQTFARAEAIVSYTLWHYAKTPHSIARAIFSGTRIKEATGFINRILEATDTPQETREELRELFRQLTDINAARNDILHFGAVNVATASAIVTNEFKAHTNRHVRQFPTSAELLNDMIFDLRKIMVHLRLKHSGIPELKAAENLRVFAEVLAAPWRYRHQPQPTPPSTAQAKSPLAHKAAQVLTRQPLS